MRGTRANHPHWLSVLDGRFQPHRSREGPVTTTMTAIGFVSAILGRADVGCYHAPP